MHIVGVHDEKIRQILQIWLKIYKRYPIISKIFSVFAQEFP